MYQFSGSSLVLFIRKVEEKFDLGRVVSLTLLTINLEPALVEALKAKDAMMREKSLIGAVGT